MLIHYMQEVDWDDRRGTRRPGFFSRAARSSSNSLQSPFAVALSVSFLISAPKTAAITVNLNAAAILPTRRKTDNSLPTTITIDTTTTTFYTNFTSNNGEQTLPPSEEIHLPQMVRT